MVTAVRSDVTLEMARGLVDRVAQELGFNVKDTSGFLKVQAPGSKHRVYVQLSQRLGRIDTTVPLDVTDADYVQLRAPNGSIHCHVRPELASLERVLRMMADPGLAVQVPNKPRPFAATKAPASRKVKPVVAPVPAAALVPLKVGPHADLAGRLKVIHDRSRELRVNRLMDEDPLMSRREAESRVDASRKAAGLPVPSAEAEEPTLDDGGITRTVDEALAEAGVEVTS